MAQKKSRALFAIAALTLAFTAIAYISLSSSTYLEVSDLKKISSPSRVSVMGYIVEGSAKITPETVSFELTDGVTRVKVVYRGPAQYIGNATAYTKVTVEGVYYPSENLIEASKILFTCPSKQEVEAAKSSG